MLCQKICIPVALQRYVAPTPVVLRQIEMGKILASHYGAELAIVTVEAPVPLLPHLEATEVKLENLAAPVVTDGYNVTVRYDEGIPSRAIRSFVDEWSADTVIIGSHSKRGILDVGVGSTASALRHDLKAMVLMVRPTQEESNKAKELMIPTYPFVFPYG